MKKIDIEKLKQTIINYDNLPKSSKKEADSKIASTWSILYKKFATKCSEDKELDHAFDELKRIDQILAFKIEEHYTEYSHTVNAFDVEGEQEIYHYSPKKFEEAKNSSENWDTIKAGILAKIEKAKASKFPFGKEAKIYKLEKELKDKEIIVRHYRECIAKQKEKEYYMSRKDEVDAIRKLYQDLVQKYAEQVIEENIEEFPIIVCHEHRGFYSGSGFKSYDMTHMNTVCNDLRKQAKDAIASDAESALE